MGEQFSCFPDTSFNYGKDGGVEIRVDHPAQCGTRVCSKLTWLYNNGIACCDSGYRWHQKDKNVRGILFPDESLATVEARIRKYAELLNLEIQLKVEACGSKVILLSPRPLALGTRMRRALGTLKRA